MNSREREREREREARTHQSAPFARTKLQSVPFASTSTVDRDPRSRSRLRADRDRRGASRDHDRHFARSRSTLCEIAPSVAISRSCAVLREIAIDSAVVGLELAKHRAVKPSRASSVNLGFVRVF